jgi:hypothetical protein
VGPDVRPSSQHYTALRPHRALLGQEHTTLDRTTGNLNIITDISIWLQSHKASHSTPVTQVRAKELVVEFDTNTLLVQQKGKVIIYFFTFWFLEVRGDKDDGDADDLMMIVTMHTTGSDHGWIEKRKDYSL